MFFSSVAQSFSQIESTPSRNEMTVLFADLLKKATPKEANNICNIALGELYPPYHTSLLNIAEKTMVPVIAAVMGQSETVIKNMESTLGDLGLVVAQGSWRKRASDLSVSDVYSALVAIEKITGTGSQEKKAAALQELLEAVDPESAKYIVRIVLGKLRLGFSDMSLIDALSWMEAGDKSLKSVIENAYNNCVDIGLIAQILKKEGVAGVQDMQITVGIPIRPAAAERLPTAAAIFEKLGSCIAQPKLDGFRLQIHVDNSGAEPKISFFSRNLKDMSAMFPDLVAALKKLKVKTLICEGEAIGYDADADTFLPFQETVKRKRKHGVHEAAQESPLKLFLFDLLYLNGKPVLDLTHEERYHLLEKTIPQQHDSPLMMISERKITNAQQLQDYFDEVIAEGLEGLVVKRPDANYQPGKRNFNWIKLKRTSDQNLEDTIDAVILGYYTGSGRRAQFGIGAILVGVYDKAQDAFVTVSKVGTGFTDAQWHELKKKCDQYAVSKRPVNVICAPGLYPDQWVSPEIVVELFADEITKSPIHTAAQADGTGLALRFPRFMNYREDKSAVDATSAKELKEMFNDQGKK